MAVTGCGYCLKATPNVLEAGRHGWAGSSWQAQAGTPNKGAKYPPEVLTPANTMWTALKRGELTGPGSAELLRKVRLGVRMYPTSALALAGC